MGGSATFAPLLLELWEVGFQHHKAHQALQILPVTMAPKKRPTPTWVESTPAPPKAKVPKVTELNKLTSSESRGILFTVEGIDPHHRGEIAAGWVCGSGLRSFRTRAKVFLDAG